MADAYGLGPYTERYGGSSPSSPIFGLSFTRRRESNIPRQKVASCRLSVDLIYGVETRALNRAVKGNTNRLPMDFVLQLTRDEFDALRRQIGTASKRTDGAI